MKQKEHLHVYVVMNDNPGTTERSYSYLDMDTKLGEINLKDLSLAKRLLVLGYLLFNRVYRKETSFCCCGFGGTHHNERQYIRRSTPLFV